MKFVYPDVHTVMNTDDGYLHVLVVERQELFQKLLLDIVRQISGETGYAVVSEENTPLPFPKYVEIIDRFVPFELNRRPLLNKIMAALEKDALSERHYVRTMQLLSQMEQHLQSLATDFFCDVVFPPLTASALLKSAAPMLRGEDKSPAELTLDYMQLVCEFDRPKLFVTVNMRSYIPDREMELFADTVLSHGFRILMLENREYPRFAQEKRWIVDSDLCEIT